MTELPAGRALLLLMLAAIAAVIAVQVPEIRRYLKVRAM
jgi:hypothetical protein